jgi:hypothetical protein
VESPGPFFVTLAIIGALVYQVGFRYTHWTGGPNREVTYELDHLTGETHQVRPGEKVDFISRLFGSHKKIDDSDGFGSRDGLDNGDLSLGEDGFDSPRRSSRRSNNSRWKDLEAKNIDFRDGSSEEMNSAQWAAERRRKRIGLDPESDEAYTLSMLETSDEMPLRDRHSLRRSENTKTSDAQKKIRLTPIESEVQVTKSSSVQLSEDLNSDGAPEKVIKTMSVDDGLLDYSVVSGGKEVFYQRGKDLKVLNSKRKGWYDLLLKTSDKQQKVFHYNPLVEGYETQTN